MPGHYSLGTGLVGRQFEKYTCDRFQKAWPEESIVQQVAGQLPWFHNCTILEKLRDREERLWYAQAVIENGWSRNVLVIHIESDLYRRQSKAKTNFQCTRPAPQSDP